MWISRLKLTSYASFSSSDWIELDRKFNLFVGQNNSGKSTLLKSLSFPLVNNPHKNEDTFRGTALVQSRVDVDIKISVAELFDRFSKMGSQPTFPVGNGEREKIQTLQDFLNNPENVLTLELSINPGQEMGPREGSSLKHYRGNPNTTVLNYTRVGGNITFVSNTMATDNLGTVGHSSAGTIFHFAAQRLNVGRSALLQPDKLLSDASNLPAVLAHLQGARRPIFDKIEQHAISILGGFERVSVVPKLNEFHILIWPDRESIYEELAFELNESGTGIGQLLAILTAVVTSEKSVIIVDEINSFLHPGAVKKLLSLLRSEYPQHQYIISTHSADTIASCNAERLYIVERNGFSSSLKEVQLKDAQHAREIAGTLGFSMMDVFGFERMVWVEGPTEEVCFPYLIRHFEINSSSEIGFASVGSPAAITVDAKKNSLIDVYERAGKQLSPLLRGMAFALDRERLSDEEVTKQERSKRKLRLLPRRCFECYLISPMAIAEIASQLDEKDVRVEEVIEALRAGAEEKYGAPNEWNGDVSFVPWLTKVDAAKLLNHVFQTVTDHRVEYRKTRDAITLTRWISENEPDMLSDMVEFLRKILEIAMRDTPP